MRFLKNIKKTKKIKKFNDFGDFQKSKNIIYRAHVIFFIVFFR